MMEYDTVLDADGNQWQYRLVGSVLERRRKYKALWSSEDWSAMQDHDWQYLTPTVLRHIADVLDGGEPE